MDEDLVNLCTDFVKTYPMDEELDAQEFFETVDEVELIDFFQKLYALFRPLSTNSHKYLTRYQ